MTRGTLSRISLTAAVFLPCFKAAGQLSISHHGDWERHETLLGGQFLASPTAIVRAYGPERNALFAIVILPVQSGTASSTPVSKHQRPERFQRPWVIKTLGVNDELSAKFRYTD
jgi:hypothetical protein